MPTFTPDSYSGWISGGVNSDPLVFDTPGPYSPTLANNYNAPVQPKNDSNMFLATLLPGLLGNVTQKKTVTDMSGTIAANDAALSGGNNTALYIGLAVFLLMIMIFIFMMMNK